MTSADSSQSALTFVCPRCKSPTSLANVSCHVCGANLVLAVARSMSDVLSAAKQEVGLPYEADRLLPRFGEFLLRNGDITKAQLEAALERQRAAPGQPRTIGQTLLEMGVVNREQLDRASLSQIRELQDAVEVGRRRVRLLEERAGKLEFAVKELAELSQSIINFIERFSIDLRIPLTVLKNSPVAQDASLQQAISDLERLEGDLRAFAAGERK